MRMKFMLSMLIIVVLKCNRLSSAPTDFEAQLHVSNRNNNSDDQSPPSDAASYVTNTNDDDDDAGKSSSLFEFRRSIRSDNTEIEARRRSAVDKGFMRFGRGGNMLRFGRSMPSEYDNVENEEDDTQINEPYSMKMRRGNMMRFGKRNPSYGFSEKLENQDYSDDASENYDLIDQPVRRSPKTSYNNEPGVKILRLGRSSSESAESSERPNSREKKPTDGNILRFGRADNMMRFGRADNMMRFGRGNMMRFGRGDNMLRFGRGNMMRFGRAGNVMRFGKRASSSDDNEDFSRSSRAGNVLRFGRSDKNPMRFGKRGGDVSSSAKIYCEDYNCLLQEKEKQIMDNDNDEQLKSLFGVDQNDNEDDAKQSLHNEYIIQK